MDDERPYRAAYLPKGDQRLWLIPFYTGDGPGPILLTVSDWAQFLRGPDNTCAFCHGDPCAEYSDPDSLIGTYFARNKSWAETCPCCNGRPT